MANVNPLFINSDGLPQGMADSDTMDLGGLTMTGDIAMGSNEVTGLPSTPSGDTAAASKAYVDAVASGLAPKDSAVVATTAPLSTWSASGSGVGKTLTAPTNASSYNDIDSVTLSLNDRVLVKDGGPSGSPDADNGIYYVTALGNDTDTSFELTRATDFDTTTETVAGSHLWVTEGNTYADTAWVVTTNDPITVDTTDIEWSQYGGTGTYTGGDGITISTNTISVDLATISGLEFSSGELRIDAYQGVAIDANGLSADPGAGIGVDGTGIYVDAGDGLTTSGGDLDIDLSSTPGLEFSTGQLQVLVDPAGAILRQAAGLHVNTDDSTIQINGSNQLEVINVAIAQALKFEVTANEAVSAGDPVFWGGANNEIQESQASTAGRKKVVGVMEDAVSASGTGTMVLRGVCSGVLSSATVGTRYFLAAAGGLTTSPPTTSGDLVCLIGHAKNADDLDVLIQIIGLQP